MGQIPTKMLTQHAIPNSSLQKVWYAFHSMHQKVRRRAPHQKSYFPDPETS